jgi:2-polyprenyl-6-methoxyphenol hydroxylase-like FAD-dependent oxidoreductase
LTDPPRDVVVIGGCGHAGLPLAIAFADRGTGVGIYDLNEDADIWNLLGKGVLV